MSNENPQASNTKSESILHMQDYFMIFRSRWREALLVFLLVFVSCAVVTRIMTPQYTSSIRFEIKMPRDAIAVGTGDVSPILTQVNSSYMQTQFELLNSEQNLRAIAAKLDLASEWGTDEGVAARMLMGMIRIRPVQGMDLVDVTVTNSDPRMAQRICAAVEECYREVREDKENALINRAITSRWEVLRTRQDELDRKYDVIRKYIASGDYVTTSFVQGNIQTADMLETELAKLISSRSEHRTSISFMLVHSKQIQGLKDEELLNYVTRTGLLTAETYSSQLVRTLHERFKQEEESYKSMEIQGYGRKHPTVQLLDTQHETTKAELFKELIGMREAMERQLDLKNKELKEIEEQLADVREKLRNKNMKDQEVMAALEAYKTEKARHDKLQNDYITDKMRMLTPRITTDVHTRPTVAGAPSSPNYKLNLTTGAVLGIIAGLVVAFVYNHFDTSIRTLEDAERHLGLPVLGVIPQDAGLLILDGGDSPDAEAYRILRTNIELKKGLHKATVFVVVSANAAEGKTTTLSNLSYVFAQAGYSTLMVDADLRRPRLARYAEVKSDVGLSNYLTSDMELRDVIFKTTVPNLYMMASGPQPNDPSGIIGSYRMEQLLQEASRRFDIVFIDSPPILGVSDASLLVSKADATLVVLQPRKMPLKGLIRAKTLIENAGGKIMGLVMNNVDVSTDTQYQYYTTYYSYYTSNTGRSEPKTQGAANSPALQAKHKPASAMKAPMDDSADDLY